LPRRRPPVAPHFGVSDTTVSAMRRLATSDALVRLVRPFELHSVGTELLGLPGADVADLAIGSVVPPLPRNGIGNRLAQLVRAGGRQRVEHREAARTAGAARIGHHGIERLGADGIVVAAKRLRYYLGIIGFGNVCDTMTTTIDRRRFLVSLPA